jgi:hypothetical protein
MSESVRERESVCVCVGGGGGVHQHLIGSKEMCTPGSTEAARALL